jgi:ABC-2 type transport system permease protein
VPPWRAHEGLASTLAGFGLLLLFGFAMTWVGTFIANTFVPAQGMPVVLRTMADWNPLSATVAACRQLFGNPGAAPTGTAWPLQNPVAASLGFSLLLLAIFVPLTVGRYRTATLR